MAAFTMPLSLYMSAPVHAVAPSDDLDTAHRRLAELRISSLAVTEGDRIVGVVSRTDLLRVGRRQAGMRGKAALLTLPKRPVSTVMTREVIAFDVDEPVTTAATAMVGRHLHRVFALDDGALAGVLSTKDIMLAIRDRRVRDPIATYMSTPVFTVRAEEPIALATERLERAHVTGLIVVEDEWPVGVFTQVEALEARDSPRDTPVEEAMSPALLCLDSDTRMHRAAAQAAATRVRRVVAVEHRQMRGILTGLDFTRVAV